MKHIGWCLEQIQIVMVRIPRSVISQEDKEKAKKILVEVQEYANTLGQLVQSPTLKEYLRQLENTSIEAAKLQAQEVGRVVKDLEHMLYVLELYIQNLNDIISNHPEQWVSKADQLVLMIDQKFGNELGKLRKEFQIALHTKENLMRIVSSEEHLAEFLK